MKNPWDTKDEFFMVSAGNVQACQAKCGAGCVAVTMYRGGKKCYLRSAVNLAECDTAVLDKGAFDTYVDSSTIRPPSPPGPPPPPKTKADHMVDALNERFRRSLGPPTKPLEAGVLLHQGAQDPDAPWRPCSRDRTHWLCQLRAYEGWPRVGKVSTSLVFAERARPLVPGPHAFNTPPRPPHTILYTTPPVGPLPHL